jgi:sulfotransferase family protein
LGDKTPPYGLFLREVESILPEAHFIHLIRDGRDVALSVRKLWFAPGRDIETIARDWCSRIQVAREAGKECRSYLEIRYEDLICNTTEQLKKICAFLVLDYYSEMENYFWFSLARLSEVKSRYRSDGTLLISKEERLFNHRFTNFPPVPTRLFRWKREMDRQDLLSFERIAGIKLEELGYEITSPKEGWITE